MTLDRYQPDTSLAATFGDIAPIVFATASGKSHIISQLVQALVDAGLCDAAESQRVIADLLYFESKGNTTLSHGLAIPHLRTPSVERCAGVIGLAPGGVNFGPIRDSQSQLVFLLLSPWAERDAHMTLLAKLAKLAQVADFRRECLENPRGLRRYLSKLDQDWDKRTGQLSENTDGSNDSREAT